MSRGCPIAKELAIRLDLLAVDYKKKRLKAGEIFKIIARELREVELQVTSEANKFDRTQLIPSPQDDGMNTHENR